MFSRQFSTIENLFSFYLTTHLNRLSISFCWTSLSMTIGCWHGLALRSLLKYGLQADRTTLWAVKEQPSHANVTSTKSSSSLKCRNEDSIDEWKSFHRSEYCCSGEVSPPIGQSEGAISTPMVMPFRLHHWNTPCGQRGRAFRFVRPPRVLYKLSFCYLILNIYSCNWFVFFSLNLRFSCTVLGQLSCFHLLVREVAWWQL